MADNPNDQSVRSGELGTRCTDRSLEVVESGVIPGEEYWTIYVQVADADAEFVCSPSVMTRHMNVVARELKTFHIYTEPDPEHNYHHYIAWIEDGYYGTGHSVSIFDAHDWASAEIPALEERNGNTYQVRVPSTGILTRWDGTPIPYDLQDTFTYYGYTEASYYATALGMHLNSISGNEDRFGDTFDV